MDFYKNGIHDEHTIESLLCSSYMMGNKGMFYVWSWHVSDIMELEQANKQYGDTYVFCQTNKLLIYPFFIIISIYL